MSAPNRSATSSRCSSAADALLARLDHPHHEGIALLRHAILALDPRIQEEVKWNAPSFRLDDHFATFKLHPPRKIQLVLHTGARPAQPGRPFSLQDAGAGVQWAAPDRCVITLDDTAAVRARLAQIAGLVRQWMQQL